MSDSRSLELSQQAESSLAHGRIGEAREIYKKLVELDGSNEEIWLMLSVTHGELGDLPEALDCAETAISLDPTYVEARLVKAQLLQRLEQFEDAIASALEAVDMDDGYGEAWLFLGGVAGQLGRTDDAVTWAERAVTLMPDSSEALINLGNAHYQQNQFESSEADFRRANQITPGVIATDLGIAKSIEAQQRFSEAMPLLLGVVEREPDNVEAMDHLGLCYINLGYREDATSIFNKIIARDASYVYAYIRVARIFAAQGDYENAIEYLNRGLENTESPLAILGDLAEVYHDAGMQHMAVDACNKALELEPGNFIARFYRAVCMRDYGRYEDAMEELDKLSLEAPDDMRIVVAKADILERIGDVDDAYKLVQPYLASDPEPHVIDIYARICHRHDDCDRVVGLMKDILERDDLQMELRRSLLFTLGQVLDRQKDYDQAFGKIAEANALKPIRYDKQKFVNNVDRLIAPEVTDLVVNMPQKEDHGFDVRPIFIVGMPRSGTSLVEQIIASHPCAYGGGERHELNMFSHRLSGLDSSNKEYPESLVDLSSEMISELANEYIRFFDALPNGISVVTDKMPGNFVHLVFIRLLFPDARIIHCMRNPVDTCLSCYFQEFAGYHDYAYDLDALGAHYVQYKRLMNFYRDEVGIPMLEINYEDLVANAEKHIRKLIAYVGLEWDEQCLSYYELDRVMRTASYDQVRQPIYSSSVERWRHYEKHLQPLLEALGVDS